MPTRLPTAPRAARAPKLAPEGLVVAVVAVTGVMDHVGDIIQPGSFKATLMRRRPKFVFSHDMTDFVGRVLHIEEMAPGDARLPKKQPNGQPWPKEAGALIATLQANMATTRGREVWEWTRFYAETGEAQFSIGYKVPKSLQVRRPDGVRLIYGLELYEVSLVLHGANSLTMALEVKSDGPQDGTEHKTGPVGGVLEGVEVKAAAAAVAEAKALPVLETKYDDSPMGTPGNKENWVDQVGGLPPYIRAVARGVMRSGHSKSQAISMAVGAMKRWASGGDNVTAKTRAKAAKAVAEWEAKKAAAHADNAGKSDTLKAAGLAVRAADTGRVLMLQRALEEGDPAAGHWEFPGGKLEDGEDALVAAMREWQEETGAELPTGRITGHWTSKNGVYRGYVLEVASEEAVAGNLPHGQRAVLNPDDPDGDHIEVVAWFDPTSLPSMPSLRAEVRETPWSLLAGVETKSAVAAVMEAKALNTRLETKSMSTVTGSYEEQHDRLREALEQKLGGEKRYVSVVATYPDRVIVRRYNEGSIGSSTCESFALTYTTAGTKVTLGEPTPVTLQLVAVDDAAEAEVPDEAAVLVPSMLEHVRTALAAMPMQAKTLAQLETPLLALLDGFAAKGMDVPSVIFGEEPEEEDPETESDLDEEEPLPTPAAPAPAAPVEQGVAPQPDVELPDPVQETTDLVDEEDVEAKGGMHSGSAGTVTTPSLGTSEEVEEDEDTVVMDRASLDKDLEDIGA